MNAVRKSKNCRFYQKSKLLLTPPEEDSVYEFGETELIILSQKFTFPNGVSLPHEIFHLFTMELSRKFGFPEYPFFSNSDEITSDYLEEIFALAYQESDKLIFDIDSIDRNISNILDCSIIFLQLGAHHKEIVESIKIPFPPYASWGVSKSPLLFELEQFEQSGVLTNNLELIENKYLSTIGDSWTKYVMAAHYAKQMFNLLLRDREVNVRDDKLILTVRPKNDYLKDMYNYVQAYRAAFDLPIIPGKDFLEFEI